MKYIEIMQYADDEIIDNIKNKLSEIYTLKNSKGKNVNEDGIKIFTINGFELLRNIPEILFLYNYTYELIKKKYCHSLEHLKEIDIAISANVLSHSEGDNFRMHFDRNQITCIVYLSDNPYMPLKIYPNVRPDPLIDGKKIFEIKNYQEIYIRPTRNSAVIFKGNRSFHGIVIQSNGEGNIIKDNRYSIQFGFNIFKNIIFSNENYYGR